MDHTIKTVLELSRCPMFALEDGAICFMNAAAQESFPSLRAGDSASSFLPDVIDTATSDSFLFDYSNGGVHYTVSAARICGMLLLSFAPDPSAGSLRGCLSDALMSGILSTLFNIGLSTERLRATLGTADPEVRKYLGTLGRGYYTLRRRFSNLNTLCALSDGDMELVLRHTDLVRLCADVVASTALLTREDYAAVEFHTELESLPACLDAEKVEHLILNLLTNSLLHTPKTGLVRLRLSTSGASAVISVDDNGSGIPSAVLKSVFSSYHERLDPEALRSDGAGGLGLALCRVIAEKHGGALVLESREGAGTTVRALFPLSPPCADGLESTQPEYTNGGMSLLLTELSDLLDRDVYADGFSE